MHKAELRVDGKLLTVAVKVRHPGVVTRITQDFQLLIPLARASSKVRALKVPNVSSLIALLHVQRHTSVSYCFSHIAVTAKLRLTYVEWLK